MKYFSNINGKMEYHNSEVSAKFNCIEAVKQLDLIDQDEPIAYWGKILGEIVPSKKNPNQFEIQV